MKYDGEVIIGDPGSDRPIERVGTLQCVHCGKHWIHRPGSGQVRGYCTRCNGPVCGAKCAECVPQEQMLEQMEGTRNPTAVTFAGKLWLPPGAMTDG